MDAAHFVESMGGIDFLANPLVFFLILQCHFDDSGIK